MLAVNIIIYREINMKERKLQGGFMSLSLDSWLVISWMSINSWSYNGNYMELEIKQ